MSPERKSLARLAIHQATTEKQWGLAEAIRGYARRAARGITVRRDKLAACGIGEARRLPADHGVTASGLSRAFAEEPCPEHARRTCAGARSRRC